MRNRGGSKDRMVRTLRELAVMLEGRVPVDRALAVLIRQQGDKHLHTALQHLHAEVQAGLPLSAAFAANGRVFGPALAAASRAGEASGKLPEILLRLCAHLEQQRALRRRLQAALIYPLVLLVVTTLCVVLLLGVVVPRLGDLIAAVAGEQLLPAPTRFVLGVAEAGNAALPVILVLAVTVPAGAFWLRKRRIRMAPLSRLPVVGRLASEQAVARGASTLATLTEAGVPLTDSLLLAGDACGDPHVAASFQTVSHRVLMGHRLSEALKAEELVFSPAIIEMAAVAEESGQLPELMRHLASETEERCLAQTQALVALVEPALLVGVALVVGLVVAALFLPILQLLESMSAL